MDLLFTDVGYHDGHALAAGVRATSWHASTPAATHTVRVEGIADYEPGAFFRRELPCLLALLRAHPLPDCVVVDGHAWLATGRPGLGAHLYRALAEAVVVVGVAKNHFAGSDLAVPVLRGQSTRPLYVTACGMGHHQAAAAVAAMHGEFRVPTLLRMADAASRGRAPQRP